MPVMYPGQRQSPTHSVPSMTLFLGGLQALVFVILVSLVPSVRDNLVRTAGVLPANLTNPFSDAFPASPLAWLTLLSAGFLHTTWLQFLWNGVTLLLVGPRLQASYGPRSFIVLYLAFGAAVFLEQVFLTNSRQLVLIGASGSLAGLLGTFAVLHWSERVSLGAELGQPPRDIPIPYLIGAWFLLQILLGSLSYPPGSIVASPAWWAILSGFGFGFLVARQFTQPHNAPAARSGTGGITFNPYDNPDEEYRPVPHPEARLPYDNEDEEI